MTSTALFDGYLPESGSNPNQRLTSSAAVSSVYSLDESLSLVRPSSSVGRMRLGSEGEQMQSLLDAMPEGDEQRGDDEHAIAENEHGEMPSSRGHRPRADSVLPTPTPSINGSFTPSQSQLSTRSGHRQQHQVQHASTSAQSQSQGSRKNQVSFAPGARIR